MDESMRHSMIVPEYFLVLNGLRSHKPAEYVASYGCFSDLVIQRTFPPPLWRIQQYLTILLKWSNCYEDRNIYWKIPLTVEYLTSCGNINYGNAGNRTSPSRSGVRHALWTSEAVNSQDSLLLKLILSACILISSTDRLFPYISCIHFQYCSFIARETYFTSFLWKKRTIAILRPTASLLVCRHMIFW